MGYFSHDSFNQLLSIKPLTLAQPSSLERSATDASLHSQMLLLVPLWIQIRDLKQI